MKYFFIILLSTLLLSCNAKVDSNAIPKINGYWEIQQVVMPNGEKKEYKINETIEFFQILKRKGFRQKVMPQFDGRFLTNTLKDTIQIIQKENQFFILNTTRYGKWEEEIIQLEDSILVIKDKKKVKYTYKRYIPFSIK
jgi:hypothetical protein